MTQLPTVLENLGVIGLPPSLNIQGVGVGFLDICNTFTHPALRAPLLGGDLLLC
ncbi:MAG: hypothetical protein HC790_13745 [Acaryochloridaceae cyanobacterium CSU_3_4]|nr:hypothetical protein [Acaryochloridaceae cyanobacterium CSU_3_4]